MPKPKLVCLSGQSGCAKTWAVHTWAKEANKNLVEWGSDSESSLKINHSAKSLVKWIISQIYTPNTLKNTSKVLFISTLPNDILFWQEKYNSPTYKRCRQKLVALQTFFDKILNTQSANCDHFRSKIRFDGNSQLKMNMNDDWFLIIELSDSFGFSPLKHIFTPEQLKSPYFHHIRFNPITIPRLMSAIHSICKPKKRQASLLPLWFTPERAYDLAVESKGSIAYAKNRLLYYIGSNYQPDTTVAQIFEKSTMEKDPTFDLQQALEITQDVLQLVGYSGLNPKSADSSLSLASSQHMVTFRFVGKILFNSRMYFTELFTEKSFIEKKIQKLKSKGLSHLNQDEKSQLGYFTFVLNYLDKYPDLPTLPPQLTHFERRPCPIPLSPEIEVQVSPNLIPTPIIQLLFQNYPAFYPMFHAYPDQDSLYSYILMKSVHRDLKPALEQPWNGYDYTSGNIFLSRVASIFSQADIFLSHFNPSFQSLMNEYALSIVSRTLLFSHIPFETKVLKKQSEFDPLKMASSSGFRTFHSAHSSASSGVVSTVKLQKTITGFKGKNLFRVAHSVKSQQLRMIAWEINHNPWCSSSSLIPDPDTFLLKSFDTTRKFESLDSEERNGNSEFLKWFNPYSFHANWAPAREMEIDTNPLYYNSSDTSG